jgi:multidrug efflux pump subunit AcrA (membrane-fusion protein)
MLKRSLFILVVVALVVGGGYYVWGRLQETVKVDPPQMVMVKRGMFVHEILGRGSVDSAKNEEIRCRVESAGEGGLTIVTVVPEGTLVKKGDLLIELESSWLEERAERQKVIVINSQSRLDQALADLETAELTLTEYLEGTFVQQYKTTENELSAAKEQVRTQEDNLSFYQRLLERGYVTQSKVDADLIELDKAMRAMEIAELKLSGLEKFTKEKMVAQYKAAISTVKSRVIAEQQTLQIDSNRLTHLERQLANCRIYAPTDGQVVYFMPRWGGDENLIREGMRVIDKQILLHLPDPAQMQVKGLINEANVRFVKPGQRASVRLEAFLDETFEGEVTLVNTMPEPSGWGGQTMSREYLTTVKILNPPEGTKTGLTAEVRIVVNEIPDALLLPMQAVFTYGGQTYAITYKEGKWGKVEVKTGPTNDREVVILEGLNEGDEVVLGAWTHRDKIELPQLDLQPNGEEEVDEETFLEQMRQEEMPPQGVIQQGGAQQGGTQQGGSPAGPQRERPAGGSSPGSDSSAAPSGGTPR